MPENKRQTACFVVMPLILIGVATGLNRTFDTVSWRHDFGQMGFGILMLAFAGPALAFGNMGEKLNHLLLWAMIFVVGMIGYSYRHELSSVKEKVLAELIRSKGVQSGHHSARFPVPEQTDLVCGPNNFRILGSRGGEATLAENPLAAGGMLFRRLCV